MMELEFTTGLMNFAAAALTIGAVAIPLFKKNFIFSTLGRNSFDAKIGANHG